MVKKLSAVQARKNFGQILEEVYYRGAEVILERSGRGMAVIVPITVYEQLKRQREQDFVIFDEIQQRNRNVDPKQLEADVARAIHEVRQARTQKRRKASSRR
jgi:prevent-host-death family protein